MGFGRLIGIRNGYKIYKKAEDVVNYCYDTASKALKKTGTVSSKQTNTRLTAVDEAGNVVKEWVRGVYNTADGVADTSWHIFGNKHHTEYQLSNRRYRKLEELANVSKVQQLNLTPDGRNIWYLQDGSNSTALGLSEITTKSWFPNGAMERSIISPQNNFYYQGALDEAMPLYSSVIKSFIS